MRNVLIQFTQLEKKIDKASDTVEDPGSSIMSPKKLYFSVVFPTNLCFNAFLFNVIVTQRLFYLFDMCIMRKQQMLSSEKRESTIGNKYS